MKLSSLLLICLLHLPLSLSESVALPHLALQPNVSRAAWTVGFIMFWGLGAHVITGEQPVGRAGIQMCADTSFHCVAV